MPLTGEVPRRQPRSRGGAQEEASGRTRSRILTAAEGAFVARGFNATSLREIAARAEMSHTGLLHHYPDKIALLEALLDDRMKRAGDLWEVTDGQSFMRGLVDIARRDAAHPDHLRLVATLVGEAINPSHPAHGYFRDWHRSVEGHIKRALDDLDAAGLFRGAGTTAQAARHINSLREGAQTQWLLSGGDFDLAEEVKSQLNLFVDLQI